MFFVGNHLHAWSLWSFIIYGPLLLAAFVLSIVAMSQRRIIGGVALLLATLIVATILWVVLAAQRTHQFAETLSKELHSDSISASSVESLPESSTTGTPTSLDTNEAPATVEAGAVVPTASATEDDTETAPSTNKTAQASSVREVIDGAFGKKLGDVFDPASAIGKEALTDGTPMYRFTPENSFSFRSFTEYYVLITPVSHKIYSIWGRGSVANISVQL